MSGTDEDVFFMDVEASAALDAPTLVEGVTYVTYTYGLPPSGRFRMRGGRALELPSPAHPCSRWRRLHPMSATETTSS